MAENTDMALSRYQETEEVLQEIVTVFSSKDDMASVRDNGRTISEMQAAGEERHEEMLQDIKGAPAPAAAPLAVRLTWPVGNRARRPGCPPLPLPPPSVLSFVWRPPAPTHPSARPRHSHQPPPPPPLPDARPPTPCPAHLRASAELVKQVDNSKSQHAHRQATLLDPTAKQQLLSEKDRITDSIHRLQDEADGIKEQISGAESRAVELSAREQQIKQQESVEVPRARHTISLYANISSIRWDYNSPQVSPPRGHRAATARPPRQRHLTATPPPPHRRLTAAPPSASPQVKGWVTSATGKGMRAFEMQPEQQTDFAISNNLWDLMEVC